MAYTQQYLDTLPQQQRGELWMQGVLEKQPDYDVQTLKDIWDEALNVEQFSCYEHKADAWKLMYDGAKEAQQGMRHKYSTVNEMFDAIESQGNEIIRQRKKTA